MILRRLQKRFGLRTGDYPKLLPQLNNLIEQIQNGIAVLKNDPMRDWFELELNQLRICEKTAGCLDEVNARIQALKQLSRLLFQHCVKIQNPEFDCPVKDELDSFLTVQARLPANVLDSAKRFKFSIDPELLHNHQRINEQFDPVSSTAKIVGYLRGLDESLTWASKFLVGEEGKNLLGEIDVHCDQTLDLMAALFQCRYHAINAAIAKSGHEITQVIEFAAGISPRGFQWSQMSPGTIYVESDLPELMLHKSKLIRNALMNQVEPGRGVLHCCATDVLNRESFLAAIQNFDRRQPLVVVTEGLLLYFNRDEMNRFLGNMKSLLTAHPNSIWITDFVTQQNLSDLFASHPGVAAAVRRVFQSTQRQVVTDNPFVNDYSVCQHLKEFGLHVESTLSLSDAMALVPAKKCELRSLASKMVGSRQIWRVLAK